MKTKYVKPEIVIAVEGENLLQITDDVDLFANFDWEDGVIGIESGGTPGGWDDGDGDDGW